MNFTAQRVPYQQTGYFSRIITDYLSGNEFLENFPSVKKEFAIEVLQMAEKSVTNEKILNENFA